MSGTTDRRPVVAASLRAAARRHGTPVAVTDVAELQLAAGAVATAFPDPWIRTFSVKANDVSGIVTRLGEYGFGANVVSRGEWAVARRAGIPNHRTTFEGIGKTDDDLLAALRASRNGDPLAWLGWHGPPSGAVRSTS